MLKFFFYSSHLPEKTLASMQWAAGNIPLHWFFSSGDDDILFHPLNFVRFVEKVIKAYLPKDQKKVAIDSLTVSALLRSLPIICIYSYQFADKPARTPDSKWYMSEKRYPPKIWPPYCRGGWYTMTVYTTKKLHQISRETTYLQLDDVWITGIMRLKLHAHDYYWRANTSLMTKGIVAAPLALRKDTSLFGNIGEKDLNSIIVRHFWGNIEKVKVNVSKAIEKKWEKWHYNS